MPPLRPDPPSVRYLAYLLWGALFAGVVVLAGVAAYYGPGWRAERDLSYPGAFPISAGLLNMVLLAAVRLIPRALKPETPTLTKNIVATAVGEAGALYAGVAWLLTGSPHAVAGLVLGLAGMAVCYPNDSRWRALGGRVEGDRPDAGFWGDRR
ncbi:MAG TPA: hypothetical protein VLT47_01350 [Anaeromyxobacteraceae bacterium]|nr:hypothetical protein [Anaeromyxobacteraceae bacterium]